MAEYVELGFRTDTAQLVTAVREMKALDTYLSHMADTGEKAGRRLGVAMQQTARSTKEAGDSARAAGMGVLYLSQMVEDSQYGFRSVLNNIPMLVMAFGGGAGLAGAVSLAAVGLQQLSEHGGNFINTTPAFENATERMARSLKRLGESAEGYFFGQALKSGEARASGGAAFLTDMGSGMGPLESRVGGAFKRALTEADALGLSQRLQTILFSQASAADPLVQGLTAGIGSAQGRLQNANIVERPFIQALLNQMQGDLAKARQRIAEDTGKQLEALAAEAGRGDTKAQKALLELVGRAGDEALVKSIRSKMDAVNEQIDREIDWQFMQMMFGESPSVRRERLRQNENATDAMNLGAEMRADRMRRDEERKRANAIRRFEESEARLHDANRRNQGVYSDAVDQSLGGGLSAPWLASMFRQSHQLKARMNAADAEMDAAFADHEAGRISKGELDVRLRRTSRRHWAAWSARGGAMNADDAEVVQNEIARNLMARGRAGFGPMLSQNQALEQAKRLMQESMPEARFFAEQVDRAFQNLPPAAQAFQSLADQLNAAMNRGIPFGLGRRRR